jgi:hypothetical protein
MSTESRFSLSPGCRDRLMIASSVACVVALFVSILGLTRAVFNLTWPLGRSEEDQICQQVGETKSDLTSSMWARTVGSLSSRSPRPTATLAPTITPVPPLPTPAPSAPLSTTEQITAEVVYSSTAAPPFPAPILLSPEPEAHLQSEVHFRWQWDGEPLPEGLAFDLLIWSETEHQDHEGAGACGVVETDPSLARQVDLDYVQTIIEHGGGTYYWTVIVVQQEPYERVGAWGEERSFTYTVPEPPPEEPAPQSP